MADENGKPKRSYEELMALTKARGVKVQADADKTASETSKQMFLPGFDIGAMPNHLNRSSLIAPTP
jgi:hypothetical protein